MKAGPPECMVLRVYVYLCSTNYKMIQVKLMGPDDKPIMMIPPDDNEPRVT
jgi:hypothetical protein